MKPELVLLKDNQKVLFIDFGVIPVGSDKLEIYTVQNIGDLDVYDLKFKIEHADVNILQAPVALKQNEKKDLKIYYKPQTQLNKGISTALKVDGKYIV